MAGASSQKKGKSSGWKMMRLGRGELGVVGVPPPVEPVAEGVGVGVGTAVGVSVIPDEDVAANGGVFLPHTESEKHTETRRSTALMC